MTIEIVVPEMGESVFEATISRWLKKEGEQVSVGEAVVELETDKVSVEVPSPAAGVLGDILVSEGDTVQSGGKLAVMSGSCGAAAPAPAAEAPAAAPSASAGSWP